MKTTIHVHQKRWFSRRYGNQYMSARVFVNGGLVGAIPCTQVTGDLAHVAKFMLIKQGHLLDQGGALSLVCREQGHIYTITTDTAREKQVDEWGALPAEIAQD